MAIWTVSPFALTCGSCGGVIPAGQPVQLLTVKRLVRCVPHATEPVNEQEVDLERARMEPGGGADERIPGRQERDE